MIVFTYKVHDTGLVGLKATNVDKELLKLKEIFIHYGQMRHDPIVIQTWNSDVATHLDYNMFN